MHFDVINVNFNIKIQLKNDLYNIDKLISLSLVLFKFTVKNNKFKIYLIKIFT